MLLSVLPLVSSSGGYILPRLFSKSGLVMDNASSVYLYVKLDRDAKPFPAGREQGLTVCMNSASYEYRNVR